MKTLPPTLADFGARLIRLRRAKGLSQMDLLRLTGDYGYNIAAWETGRAYPGAASLIGLSQALDVSVDALLGLASIDISPKGE